jgi:hypothetical protein
MTPARQVLSCHRPRPIAPGLEAVRADGKVIAAIADVAQVHERDFGPGQELHDGGPGLPPVRDQYAVGDPALLVVGPDDLLAGGQLRRVFARRQVALAAFRVDEDGREWGARRERRARGEQRGGLT